MAPAARPENVLKRAEELIAVDQAPAALEFLYETISSKRSRNASPINLEPVMLRLVELCVELRKGKVVKDSFHQYRRSVQATNIESLEVVVKRFLELSQEKVADAQAQADKITLDADEDLEAGDSPEDILMSAVSSKERTDREVLTPWLKFVWEAYRTTLDILRNNSKLEVVYKYVVEQAFSFCLKHSRKTEFRRLCEILKSHLQTVATQSRYQNAAAQNQQNPVDLSNPDTMQRFLDIRFEQLNVAVKLELWQEAFRSVEDVHTLLTASKRPAKLVSMANYYQNLARIFIVSGNQLFHAAAWSRYYSLVLQARSVPESELTRIASFFMLSVLAIPPSPKGDNSGVILGNEDTDEQKYRNNRLSGLLNLAKPPTREALLKSALSKNVLAYARPEISELYQILEVDFHPLSIKERISPVIEKIGVDSSYAVYLDSLYQVILTRLFQQLSQVYKTVQLDFVISLASFPGSFSVSPVEIERFIVRGCQKREFGIKIDHVSKSITFRDDIYQTVNITSGEVSSLQKTPAEIVQCQLSDLARALHKAVQTVDPVYQVQVETQRNLAIERARASIEKENEEVVARKMLIEERQKQVELEKMRKEEAEAEARAARIQQEQIAEQLRLAEDKKRREEDLRRQEREAIQQSEKRKLAEEINSKGIIHIDVENLDDMDTTKLRKMQIDQLEKENKDLSDQMRVTIRRIDHLTRAYRLEEIPYWQKDAEVQQEQDKKLYETRKQALLIKSKQQYQEAVEIKSRLERLVPDYKEFRAKVEAKKQKEFEARRKENERLLLEEKRKRIIQVRAQIEKEKAQAEEKARLEEERKAREAKEAEEAAKRPARYVPGTLRARRAADTTSPAASASPEASAAPSPAREPPATLASAPRAASNPFGAARPKNIDPFGAAKPKDIDPFGAAKPKDIDSISAAKPKPSVDPFGGAKPKPTIDPFGGAKPKATIDPFGAAKGKPATGADRGSASPSASPAASPAAAPAATLAPTKGKYVPPSLRKKMQN